MVKNKINSLGLSSVMVSGHLDKRIRLGLNHLLGDGKRVLIGEGHTQGCGADGVGRWIGAVAMATSYTKDHISMLDETVKGLLLVQEPNGFFDKTLSGATWWGAGRALMGLLEYWEASQDPATLHSAERLGDFYLSNFPLKKPGLSTHHYGHEEGLVALSRATGNSEYLELAERILATVDPEFGRPGGKSGQHTHSYLTEMRGCMDLFLATGKHEHLQRAKDIWDHILQHCMWVSGGISEGSNSPFETSDETCSVADWLRLSLKLWQATGEPKYMDVAEHILLNHLYFDQDHSGGFCTYRSIGEVKIGQIRDVVAWFCCSMSGLRALLEAVKFTYTHSNDCVDINLFTTSEAEIPLKNGTVHIKQVTNYPSEPTVHVEVQPKNELSFCLRVRIPKWTRSFQMKINGEPYKTPQTREYVSIRRNWKPGDYLEVKFDPHLRLVPAGANSFSTSNTTHAPTNTDKMEGAALLYGPLVLMLDHSLNIKQMMNWGRAEILLPLRENGELFFPKVQTPIPGRGELSVSDMCFMTLARNIDDKGKPSSLDHESWKLALLVPISEISDRWTYNSSRPIPYEVRNDIRFLDKEQTEDFLAHVNILLGKQKEETWAMTTSYAILLARKT